MGEQQLFRFHPKVSHSNLSIKKGFSYHQERQEHRRRLEAAVEERQLFDNPKISTLLFP